MMMFETSKHVPKTEKRCCVLKIFTTLVLSRPHGKDNNYYKSNITINS